MTNRRLLRVNSQLQKELSTLVNNLSLPFEIFLQVTEVSTSSDLKSARVYVSALAKQGEAIDKEAIVNFLQSKAFDFQERLASQFRWKFIPKLLFLYDESPSRAQKIEKILDQLKKDDIK